MRNKRSRGVRFKKGREYTIRRIFAIFLVVLFIFVLSKLISSIDNKETDIAKIESSNSQAESDTSKNSPNASKDEKNPNILGNTFGEEGTNQTTENTTANEDISLSMAITGDIMCHNTMYQDAYNSSTKSYDFSYYFDDIKLHLQTPDITVGNLETTLSGSKVGYSGYPTFNTPEILAKNLKKAGFDVVSTANNHCMDKGYKGIESTIKYLDEADLSHTGTFTSKKAQETILIKNVKNVNIAFLSFTYGTNGIPVPKDKSYAVNFINKDFIKQQLFLAQKENPDIICVCMHWGIEYQTTPNKEQKDLADFLFKNGADIIIGNHPHVPQPMEKRTIKQDDGTTRDGFIIYSLGNFMANQNFKYTQDSAIIKLDITKHAQDGKISIDKATYTPTYFYKNPSKKTKKFKILDIENKIKAYDAGVNTSIGKSTYNTLKAELKNIQRIIGKEIK